MLYLLMIILSNKSRGKISAIIVAVMASLSYDFFVVSKTLSPIPESIQYIMILIIMTILGVTFSVITGNLRYQLSRLNKWQQQNEWLNKINEGFSKAMINSQILELIPSCFSKVFQASYPNMHIAPLPSDFYSRAAREDSREFLRSFSSRFIVFSDWRGTKLRNYLFDPIFNGKMCDDMWKIQTYSEQTPLVVCSFDSDFAPRLQIAS